MRTIGLDGFLLAGLVFTGACGGGGGETASVGGTGSDSAGSSSSGGSAEPTTAGSDSLTGGSGSDTATTGPALPTTGSGPETGNETVSPETGNETVSPETGNETVNPDTGNETVAPGTSTSGPDTDPGTSDTGDPISPCMNGKLWTLDDDFDEGVLANVNHDAPNDDQLQITLEGFSAPKPYMFVGQTDEGWVLKIDTITGKQLARYESVRLADCPNCTPSRQGWYPSRIIVDFDGDTYVANRAFGSQGSLTKIAGGPGACIDRNGNGTIETSNDANADGKIDVASPAEFFGQDDECVLYTMALGAVDTYPRALTLDGKGNAYVGTYLDRKGYKLDVTVSPPVVTDVFDLPSSPYGFVVRGDYLYSSALGEPVMRVDLTDYSVDTMNAPGNYGIAIDGEGIGWFGGYPLARCDFEVGGDCEVIADIGSSGVAVDPAGDIWAAGDPTYKFAPDGTMLGMVSTPGGYGVAIGHDGDARVLGGYAAYRVVNGGDGQPPGAVTEYATDLPGGQQVYNYTYSDFTGFGAQNVTVKKGEWTVTHDSGDEGATWETITHNNEPEAKVPAGTSITFQVRAANLEADLVQQPWIDVVADLPVDPTIGRFLELRARLLISAEDVDESPVLSDVCARAGI